MKFKTLAGAALAITIAIPATAAPVTVEVAFQNSKATFYGLDDSITDVQAASSFELISIRDTYTWASSEAGSNRFIFSPLGLFISYSFTPAQSSQTVMGATGDWSLSSLWIRSWPTVPRERWLAEITELRTSGGSYSNGGFPTVTIGQVAAVPLPAGGLLLMTALAGAVALKRRRRHT